MLIDSTHAEETRVVVLDGNRLEDFDVETAAKKQLKGNIYLAKVVRVEPSLQAAFVDTAAGVTASSRSAKSTPTTTKSPSPTGSACWRCRKPRPGAEEEAEDAAAEAAEAAGTEYAGDEAGEPPDTDMAAEPLLPMEEDLQSAAEQPALAAAVSQDFIVAREEAAQERGAGGERGVDAAPEAAEPPHSTPQHT